MLVTRTKLACITNLGNMCLAKITMFSRNHVHPIYNCNMHISLAENMCSIVIYLPNRNAALSTVSNLPLAHSSFIAILMTIRIITVSTLGSVILVSAPVIGFCSCYR